MNASVSSEEGKQRGFFEVHAENYMGAGGPPHRMLEDSASDMRSALRTVALHVDRRAPVPLEPTHLTRFRNLVERYEPALVSEHLAWSTRRDHVL